MVSNKYLVVVTGPTAVGKTAICLKIAEHYRTEVVSADSRQFFREMKIGTAKPTEEELKVVKHHFINNLSIHDQYDVSVYEKEALQVINSLFQEKKIVILTGGSGLYIKTICEGIDQMPDIDPEVRSSLQKKLEDEGLDALLDELKVADPQYFNEIDRKNPKRVLRGLEMYYTTQKPFSSFRRKYFEKRDFEIIKIGLERKREELYERIDARMDQMIEEGLFSEATDLFPYRHLNALNTVGYKEIFDHLQGLHNEEETIRLLKRNSRHYAKRQLTWFKKDKEIKWFHPDEQEYIIQYISGIAEGNNTMGLKN